MSQTTLSNGALLFNVSIPAGSTDQVADGTGVSVLGTLTNAGTLFLDAVNYATSITFGDSSGMVDTTLTGGGITLLSDDSGNELLANTAGDRLVNVDNTIEGGGSFGDNSGLAVLNEVGGTIDGSAANNALSIQTGTQSFRNQGLIEATGAAGLVITSISTITNTGTILAAGATVTLTGSADIAGGVLAATGGAQIVTANATLDGSTSAVTIGSGATVHENDGSSLVLLGTINATGTLFDGANNYNTDLILGSPTVTLTGTGGVVLSDAGGNRIYGSSPTDDTLINQSTIAGAGQIGVGNGNVPLALVNDGLIDATGTNALVIATGGPAVINAGLIEAAGSGGLTVTGGTTIDNAGTILAASGNVSLIGGADIVGGVLASTGGTIFTGTATLDGSGTAVTIGAGATVHVDDGTNLTLVGTIKAAGTLFDGANNYNTDLILGSPTVTLTGIGGVVLSDAGGNRIYGSAATNGTLINQSTIAGAGQIGLNDGNTPLALVNDGLIDATGTNALVIATGGPAVMNAGLIEAAGKGGLTVTGGTTIDNAGTILAASGNVSLIGGADIVGGVLASTGGTIFTSKATLDGSGTAVTIGAGATVHVDDGTSLSLLGTINATGTLLNGANNYSTDLILGSPTVTLTGIGGVVLSDAGGNRIYGSSPTNDTLINQSTIAGAGQIGVNNGNIPLALINKGTIDATGINNALIIATGGPALTNTGLIEATGTAGLLITDATTIDNGGTILAAGGNVFLNGGADIVGGSLAASGNGFFANNATLDGLTATPVTLGAKTNVQVGDGTSLTLLGTIAGAGTLADGALNYNTDIILASPTVTLAVGALVLSDSGANRIYGESAADDTLINLTTIAGAGQIGVNNSNIPLALVNRGTIDATGTNALTIETGGPAVINAGLIEAAGAGGLAITNGTTIANTGTILAATGNVSLTNGADLQGGMLAAAEGSIFTANATLDGSGTAVSIAAGATVHVEDGTGLTLLGAINAQGALFDGAINYSTDLILGSPTVTLSGAAGVVLSDNRRQPHLRRRVGRPDPDQRHDHRRRRPDRHRQRQLSARADQQRHDRRDRRERAGDPDRRPGVGQCRAAGGDGQRRPDHHERERHRQYRHGAGGVRQRVAEQWRGHPGRRAGVHRRHHLHQQRDAGRLCRCRHDRRGRHGACG